MLIDRSSRTRVAALRVMDAQGLRMFEGLGRRGLGLGFLKFRFRDLGCNVGCRDLGFRCFRGQVQTPKPVPNSAGAPMPGTCPTIHRTPQKSV